MAVLLFSQLLSKWPAEGARHFYVSSASLMTVEKGLRTPRVTCKSMGSCAPAPAPLCPSVTGCTRVISPVCHSTPGPCSPPYATESRSDTSCVRFIRFPLASMWAFVPAEAFQGLHLPVEMLLFSCKPLAACLPGLIAGEQGWPASMTVGMHSYEVLSKSHIFSGAKGKDFCSVTASVALGLTQLFYLLERSSLSLARRPLSFCLSVSALRFLGLPGWWWSCDVLNTNSEAEHM